MALTTSEQPKRNRGSGLRPLSAVLTSRDASETIAHCAAYLEGVVSNTRNAEYAASCRRLSRAFCQMIIVKEGRRTDHSHVLQEALVFVSHAEGVPGRKLLAAKLMLAELRADSRRMRGLEERHKEAIEGMHSSLQNRLRRAEGSVDGLSKERTIGLERRARHDVRELRRFIDGLYVLATLGREGMLGQDLTDVRRSLELIVSDGGREDPGRATCDPGIIAARAMLHRLEAVA
jgi:hypothetical protein